MKSLRIRVPIRTAAWLSISGVALLACALSTPGLGQDAGKDKTLPPGDGSARPQASEQKPAPQAGNPLQIRPDGPLSMPAPGQLSRDFNDYRRTDGGTAKGPVKPPQLYGYD